MSRQRPRERARAGAVPVPVPEPQPVRVAAGPGNGALGRLYRSAAGEAPAGFAESLPSGGQPLPAGQRDSLEAGLGASLADVRVHTGSAAAGLAERVNAHAFTVGTDIYFGRGHYDPGSAAGYRLLAHEVTHTLQQPAATRSGPLSVSTPDHPAEHEAERVAGLLAAGRTSDVHSGQQAGLHRFSGFEHEQLGDATYADIDLGGGVTLTWGEVVALAGDEYGSVGELQAAVATPDGKARLRHRLEHDGVRGPIPAGLPTPTGDQAGNSRYIDLAMHNIAHFAGGGTAIDTWRGHHEAALAAAMQAGIDGSEPGWQTAQLTEAFGQHFLTDSFSAGHVRTPRAEIVAWYQDDFTPRVLPAFVAHVRERITQALTDDLARQMNAPAFLARQEFDLILRAVLAYLDDRIHAQFEPLFGLGISGAISGTLHDHDNERGLWVASDAHPAPWQAFGDSRLACSPTSRDQAELAVITAREQLVRARALGEIRGRDHGRPAGDRPGVVHFAFDSAALDPAAATALDRAADHLTAHPEIVLRIVGHTCPLGTDQYNDALGARRAEAVATYLMNRGVAPHQLVSVTAGEHQLVSAEQAQYPADRRAELQYVATGEEPPDLVWAQQKLVEEFGTPPYAAIERYVPREVPGMNDPQEDWHWGTLTDVMASEVDAWIAHYVADARTQAATAPELADRTIPVPDLGLPLIPGGPPITVTPVVVHPRPAVLALLDELIAHPTDFVGKLVGIPAANRSAPPPAPLVPCVPPGP
ncbi:DUF4157 domain-containing protein [Amycolatopsis sp. NPDC021455]|uniref:eCIS core domain-containing protein n=1 Tax=Amycolatopsis sp. NPDC021455 TaxID=3154901 RepID=UPI0033EC9EA3